MLLWLLVACALSVRSARCRGLNGRPDAGRAARPRRARDDRGSARAAPARPRACGWGRRWPARRWPRSLFQWLHLRAKATLPAETTARLAELQSRIRPHFLFNTLNTALALVRLDPARAEGVLEDLAELFRVAITENAESVSLAEEVELAQRYLEIEQIRFGSACR